MCLHGGTSVFMISLIDQLNSGIHEKYISSYEMNERHLNCSKIKKKSKKLVKEQPIPKVWFSRTLFFVKNRTDTT